MTTDYDIGFGVYHKPVEMKSKKVHAGDMAVVVSECTINSTEIIMYAAKMVNIALFTPGIH